MLEYNSRSIWKKFQVFMDKRTPADKIKAKIENEIKNEQQLEAEG